MHGFNPEDLLHFIEMRGFEDDWERLGLDDDDLLALQIAIMAGGKNAPRIKGTGGLRKLRFAPVKWNAGKSGAARVCFVYFETYGIVLLVVAYGKNEKDELSDEEKKFAQKLIREAEREIQRRKSID